MKRKNPIAMLSGWIALALAPAQPMPGAQGEAASAPPRSGGITGRVQNGATGNYLNMAQVTVQGTNIVTLTDQLGRYHITNAPSGTVTIEVSYTGLDTQRIALTLTPGQTAEQNVVLSSGVLKMENFVVSAQREMDSQAIAIAEQRHAPNIKNVVSADAHGDMAGGNIGEFMMYMPGITLTGEADANSVTVRGLGAEFSAVSVDGARMAHAGNTADTRAFDFKQVTINDYSRIELTKVPTPATPADSLGGSVNLVSKSAFERSTAEFRYRAMFDINGDNITLGKSPFPYEKNTYKIMPGFNFSYTNPVNKKFGYVLTASSFIQMKPQDFDAPTYNGGGTGTGATPAAPFLQSYQIVDAPKYYHRHAIGLKTDWRVTENSVLSAGIRTSYYRDDNANLNWTASAGNNGTPTPASGIAMTFGPDFTNGATGRGTVQMRGGFGRITKVLLAPNLRYRFDDGTWTVDGGVAYSKSTDYNRPANHGHFNQMQVNLREPARVVFSNVVPRGPGSVAAFSNSNVPIDLSNPQSYILIGATNTSRDRTDAIESADLNLRRKLPAVSFPAAIQIGGAVRKQERDARAEGGGTYTYNGPGGSQDPTPYLSQVFKTTTFFGLNMPWVSPVRAYEAWQQNAGLFTFTPAQLAANEVDRVAASIYLEETVSALYAQTEMRLLRNRLNVLTGVRYEKTSSEGLGPLVDAAAVFVRNTDGSFARNASGARIRRADAGANNSLEQRLLTHKERGARAGKTYDGYYPSLHFTFNLTDRFLARLAYARTIGRPDFTEIIPNSVVEEDDVDLGANPNALPGRITIQNPGLQPWAADNYDLSLEYYTDSGGMFSAGVFRKNIDGFFASSARIVDSGLAETLDLDPRYVGWTVLTKYNGGNARISGAEFNFTHSLAPLGAWGRRFNAFVNGTKLRLEGHNEADFRGFNPEMLNWGFTFTRRPFTVIAKWNYRGEEMRAPVANMGSDAFERRDSRTVLDLNIDYEFSRRLGLFINSRNLFNEPMTLIRYGSQTPDYAKQQRLQNYGVQIVVGIKGAF